MVSAGDKLLPIQVVPVVLAKVHKGQHFFLGSAVLSLGLGQRAAAICDNTFPPILNLRQYRSNSNITCVRVQDEAFVERGKGEHWGYGQELLQAVEGFSALVGPLELRIFLRQAAKWCCDGREALDESPVVGRESKKTPDLLGTDRDGPSSEMKCPR